MPVQAGRIALILHGAAVLMLVLLTLRLLLGLVWPRARLREIPRAFLSAALLAVIGVLLWEVMRGPVQSWALRSDAGPMVLGGALLAIGIALCRRFRRPFFSRLARFLPLVAGLVFVMEAGRVRHGTAGLAYTFGGVALIVCLVTHWSRRGTAAANA